MTTLTAPYSGARFTDPATGYVWELILKDGAIYEINLMSGSTFLGQWQ